MMLLVTAAIFYYLGLKLAGRDGDLPVERICYAATAGFALWLASTWLLAVTHTFTRPGLAVRLTAAAIAAAILAWRDRKARLATSELRSETSLESRITILALAPVAIWIAYILWRGAVLPPVTHDALSYHLPKAVLMVRAHGYEYFSFLIPAIRTLPVNYELLLAEVIAWSGRDDLTEWVSVLFYVLFVIGCGALAERWWRSSRAAVATVMLSAAALPVVLLNSGSHKNDLMIASFMVAAMVAAGRWINDSERRGLYLAIIATACAIGTKPQAGILALALLPFIVVRMWRGRSLARDLAMASVVSIAAFFALGGVTYAVNFARERSLLNAREADQKSVEVVPYGDWSTLWQGPYVLVAAPVAGTRYTLPVPWESRPWFWRRYEVYFSHLGLVFSLCAVAAPFAFFWTRRLKDGSAFERIAVTIAALATFAVMLPVVFKPHGLYTISLPRYALFIVPVIFAWTIAPLVSLMRSRAATVVVAIAALIFAYEAVTYGRRDTFAPYAYFQWALRHPGTRVVPFDPNRAASIVDRAAGPHDTVAIDAGFGTWIQPAFGADLQRKIEFIPQGDGAPAIPSDAQWVIVDRAYAVVWGNPNFRDLSQARQYLLRGRPTPADLRTINALRADSRWRTVFYNPMLVQAVFQRR